MKLNITDAIPIFIWKLSELTSVILFDLIHNPHTSVENRSKPVIIAIINEKAFMLIPHFFFKFML
jgi:hypothetical protein